MSLVLDKRQRAMLREMGVRVWQRAAPTAAPRPDAAPAPAAAASAVIATKNIADPDHPVRANGTFTNKTTPPPATQAARQPVAHAGGGEAAWRMGQAQALYADAAPADGPRWLVLAETPAAALHADAFNPFEGDAGKLLDNMLRAARLNRAGAVLLAPLVRQGASGGGLADALSELLSQTQPDVLLVMGRLAAQALLQSTEPLGKLRGRVHQLQGVNTIVTHDAPQLLRTPADKAKAWEDLCLAISVAGAA